jgi:DNA-binding transcriptional LysR family regulator
MMTPRNLDTGLLRTFVAIADHGGFARAGLRVHLSQPTVSLQIKRLEEQVGVKLFKRNGRELVLTEDGHGLLHYARRILALNDEAWSAFATTEIAGSVRFGMIQDLTEEVLAEIVGKFSREHPHVRLEVVVGNSTDLASALAKGTLDVALLVGQPNDATPLFRREKLAWITGKNTAIPKDGPVPLVLCTMPCGIREKAIDLLEKAQIPWRLTFSSPSIAGLKAAVRAGLGITLRGPSFLDRGLERLSSQTKLPEAPMLEIVYATGPQSSPATMALTEHIRMMGERAPKIAYNQKQET